MNQTVLERIAPFLDIVDISMLMVAMDSDCVRAFQAHILENYVLRTEDVRAVRTWRNFSPFLIARIFHARVLEARARACPHIPAHARARALAALRARTYVGLEEVYDAYLSDEHAAECKLE
jgi:hypothetical protein